MVMPPLNPLFHFSERDDIIEFVPRAPVGFPDTPPRVWAIDDHHSPLYLFPRDCPRIAWWATSDSSDADVSRLCGGNRSRIFLALEEPWQERYEKEDLFRYSLPTESFIDCHDHGVWVSEQAVTPLSIERLTDLPKMARMSGASVEIIPSLVPVANEIWGCSLHVSMIRMRNAQGWQGPIGTPVIR